MRRLLQYYAAICGIGAFPPTRRAPEFSAELPLTDRYIPASSFRTQLTVTGNSFATVLNSSKLMSCGKTSVTDSALSARVAFAPCGAIPLTLPHGMSFGLNGTGYKRCANALDSEAYERWAATYPPSHNPLMRAEQATLLKHWPEVAGLRALDLACGTGRYAKLLSACRAAQIVTRFSAAMLHQVQTGCRQRHDAAAVRQRYVRHRDSRTGTRPYNRYSGRYVRNRTCSHAGRRSALFRFPPGRSSRRNDSLVQR